MIYLSNTTNIIRVTDVYGSIKVELSINNGSTYSYILNASYDCGAFDPGSVIDVPITIPDVITTQGIIKCTSLDIPGVIFYCEGVQIRKGIDVTKTICNVSAYLNNGSNVYFSDHKDNDININNIHLSASGHISLVGVGYHISTAKAVYLTGGKWHNIGGIHGILVTGTTPGLTIYAKT